MNLLIFATNNYNKVTEIRQVLGSRFNIITLKEAGIDIDIPEPHDTIEANASEKSGVIYNLTQKDCFSEDTGLEIAALNGEPGVRSARYAGDNRSFEENINKVLQNLDGQNNRDARFKTIISLIVNKEEFLFEGLCTGKITLAPKGSNGFGYDSIFVPDVSDKTFAEMSMAEKAGFSHRKNAIEKLVLFLNSR